MRINANQNNAKIEFNFGVRIRHIPLIVSTPILRYVFA